MNKAVDSLAVSSNSWKKGKFRYFTEESTEAGDQFKGMNFARLLKTAKIAKLVCRLSIIFFH